MTIHDWLTLGSGGSCEQRTPALYQDATNEEKEFIGNLEALIASLRKLLFFKGIFVTDAYYRTAKDTLFTPEEVNITPRVRWNERYGTPYFGWEKMIRHAYRIDRNTRIKTENGSGRSYFGYVRRNGRRSQKMKVVLLAKHIPLLARTSSVSPNTFKKCSQWAQLAGPITEKKLTILRKKTRLLADIALRLSLYKRLGNDNDV